MKKSLLSLAGVALLSLMFGSIVNAQETQLLLDDAFPGGEAVSDSYIKLLNNYDKNRWYTTYTSIQWNIEKWELKLESPIIEDSDIYEAPLYRLYYSPYRIEQLKWDDGITLSSVSVKEVELSKNKQENIEFSVLAEDVDTQQIYYGFIVPFNDFEVVGTPSEELCFQFDRELFSRWDDCDTLEAILNPVAETDNSVNEENLEEEDCSDGHCAAKNCIGMDLANLTHTINNNLITVRWTAVDGDVVQVAVFDPDEEVYKSIGAVNMSDEQFNYQMRWDWEYNFKLTNGCKDVYYKVDASVKTWEPTIVPPATWPAENVLIIAIAAIVLYGAYTIFFRKSDD